MCLPFCVKSPKSRCSGFIRMQRGNRSPFGFEVAMKQCESTRAATAPIMPNIKSSQRNLCAQGVFAFWHVYDHSMSIRSNIHDCTIVENVPILRISFSLYTFRTWTKSMILWRHFKCTVMDGDRSDQVHYHIMKPNDVASSSLIVDAPQPWRLGHPPVSTFLSIHDVNIFFA